MNDLTQYIIEKLHINKDTKVFNNEDDINDIIEISNIKKFGNSILEKMKYQIEKWFRKNNIKNVNFFMIDSVESKKYISKLSDELQKRINITKFDAFYKIYREIAIGGEQLYGNSIKEISINANKNELCIQYNNFILIVQNINDK